jgi:hypothetical protein
MMGQYGTMMGDPIVRQMARDMRIRKRGTARKVPRRKIKPGAAIKQATRPWKPRIKKATHSVSSSDLPLTQRYRRRTAPAPPQPPAYRNSTASSYYNSVPLTLRPAYIAAARRAQQEQAKMNKIFSMGSLPSFSK